MNVLQINQNKTEILVIDPAAKREKQCLKLKDLLLYCHQ